MVEMNDSWRCRSSDTVSTFRLFSTYFRVIFLQLPGASLKDTPLSVITLAISRHR